jgi:hypothetical protein
MRLHYSEAPSGQRARAAKAFYLITLVMRRGGDFFDSGRAWLEDAGRGIRFQQIVCSSKNCTQKEKDFDSFCDVRCL